MSRGIICDRCGLIVSQITDRDVENMHPIWTRNPLFIAEEKRDELALLHLCDECFELFVEEFADNLNGESHAEACDGAQ